jgi:hypothetical protein
MIVAALAYFIFIFPLDIPSSNRLLIIVIYLLAVPAVIAIIYGVLNLIGWRVVACPYCTTEGKIRRLKKWYSCKYCKNDSFRRGEFLFTLLHSIKKNPLAVAGFAVALFSIFLNFFGIVSVVGGILSIVGLTQIDNTRETGRVEAIAGVIIAVISTLISIYSITQQSFTPFAFIVLF